MAKNKKTWINATNTDLFLTILKLDNLSEAQKFFHDLLTEKEIKEFSQRWKVAQLLSKKIPYKQIEKETKISPTTIARIQKFLKKEGSGYQQMLKKL